MKAAGMPFGRRPLCRVLGALWLCGLSWITDSGFAQTPHPGVLRWGADSEGGAPYVFRDPKNPENLIGFEVELVAALAEVMNMRPKFVQNQWDGLIPGLKRGNYDIVVNGLEITEDRKEQISFSSPYYVTYEQLMVRQETQDVNSLADLRGKVVGTLKFSLAHRLLEAHGGIDIRSYDGQINAYEDLANGRLDAVLMDHPIALYYGVPNRRLKFAGAAIGQMSYGIGVRKEDDQLLASINLALERLARSGRLRHVIVPQAMRLIIPPVTNDFISLFKDSSLVSIITMVELTKVYGQLASTYYDYIGIGILTAAIYFILGWPFVRLSRFAEVRFAFDKPRPY